MGIKGELMDTSEQYIKMCEKAEEIQEQRFPLKGKVLFGFTWLTCQSELQEMMGFKRLADSIDSFHRFASGYYLGTRLAYHVFKTREQLWLAFVMKEKHNKIWNGEQWA